MLLLLGVVVVALHPLQLADRLAHEVGEALHDAVHHLVAVGQRVVLRPAQLPDVGPELVGALHQIRQVEVGQGDPPLLHRLPGDADVMLRDLVAHAARARVQEQPHPALFVGGHLDEVVARAEGAELQLPPARVRAGVEARLLRLGRQPFHPRARGGRQLLVGAARRERHRALDGVTQRRQIGAQLVGMELRPHRRHPAPDVHADRRRDDRPEGRDDRTHGRALAQVRVRHQGDVRVDERQQRSLLGLLTGLVLQQAGPIHQSLVDPFHAATLDGTGVRPPLIYGSPTATQRAWKSSRRR